MSGINKKEFMMRNALSAVFCTGMLCLLAACGGGGSGESNSPGEQKTVTPVPANVFGEVNLNGLSFAGAKVELASLDIKRPEEQAAKQIRLGKIVEVVITSEDNSGPVTVAEKNKIEFNVNEKDIDKSLLYAVTITCGVNQTPCNLNNPLRAVMTGAQLLNQHWHINMLTEVAYQKLAYYVATRFNEQQVRQEMDSIANILLKQDVDGSGSVTYNDLLSWDGDENNLAEIVKRPNAYKETQSQILDNKINSNDVKLAAQRLSSVRVSQIKSDYMMSTTRVVGETAYVLETDLLSKNRLAIYSLSSETPVFVSGLDLPQHAVDLYVKDDLALISLGATGLMSVNVSNIKSPKVLATYDSTGSSAGVAVYDRYALVAYSTSLSTGVDVIDISKPDSPVRAQLSGSGISGSPATIDTTAPGTVQVQVSGNLLFVRSLWAKLEVYKLTPTETGLQVDRLGRWEHAGFSFDSMAVSGNYVYLGTNVFFRDTANLPDSREGELNILKVDDAGELQLVKRIPFERKIASITVSDNRAFVATDWSIIKYSSSGLPYFQENTVLQIYNVKKPAQPALEFYLPVDKQLDYVALQGDYVFTAQGSDGLQIFDVKAMVKPPVDALASVVPSIDGELVGGATGVEIIGNKGFLCSSKKLTAFSIEEGKAKDRIGTQDTSGTAFKVNQSKNKLYVLNLNDKDNFSVSSLDVFHDSGAASLDFMGNLLLGGIAEGMTIAGEMALIAQQEHGVQLVDLGSDVPADLGRLSISSISSWARDVAAKNGYAFVANGSAGLNIQDIHNPSNPSTVATFDVPGTAFHVATYGKFVYLSTNKNVIHVFDVSDPKNPRLVSTLNMGAFVTSMRVLGRYLYVGSAQAVNVIDLSNAEYPVVLGVVRTVGEVADIKVNEGLIYMATSFGLESVPAVPEN